MACDDGAFAVPLWVFGGVALATIALAAIVKAPPDRRVDAAEAEAAAASRTSPG